MATVTNITPGPCCSQGCPAPTQIDCLEVNKVYDSCFQTENFPNLCAPIPSACVPGATMAGASVTCDVTSTTCTFVSSSSTGIDDFANVTFAVALTVTYTITPPVPSSSTPYPCTFSVPVNFVQTVTLCAPTGTTQSCTIAGTSCGPLAIINDTVCGQLVVCLVYQSTATVQLLVPTYGFCTPAPCAVLGLPSCPPVYPSQCTSITSSVTASGTTGS